MAADAWEELLALLDRRALTAAEAEEALVGRGIARTRARAAVAKARRFGLIDDRRVAADIAERGGQGSHGVLRVQHDLERRRVPETLAADALRAVDDLARCKEALAAYLARHPHPQDRRGAARLANFLGRRGFTEESVREALTEFGIDPGWHDA